MNDAVLHLQRVSGHSDKPEERQKLRCRVMHFQRLSPSLSRSPPYSRLKSPSNLSSFGLAFRAHHRNPTIIMSQVQSSLTRTSPPISSTPDPPKSAANDHRLSFFFFFLFFEHPASQLSRSAIQSNPIPHDAHQRQLPSVRKSSAVRGRSRSRSQVPWSSRDARINYSYIGPSRTWESDLV